MSNTLEKKLRFLVEEFSYYPFWHNGCDSDGQPAGWVVSEQYFACGKDRQDRPGIFYGSPRYRTPHYDTLEAAADAALADLEDRLADATKKVAADERKKRTKLEKVQRVRA